MVQPKVIVDNSRYSDNDFAEFAEHILGCLTGNTNYKFEANVLADLKSKIDNFKACKLKAINGGKLLISAKNVAKNDLDKLINKIGKQVNVQADGNIAILESSGFTLAKEPQKQNDRPKPENVKVYSGKNHREVMFEMKPAKNILLYNVYYAQSPAPESVDDWYMIQSTKHKTMIDNLNVGKEYEFMGAYKGRSEKLIFSDVVKLVVQ